MTNRSRRLSTIQDREAAAKSLAESVELLRRRNLAMAAYLEETTPAPLAKATSAAERVAAAPYVGLDDATERARRYWDKLEGRRSSVPPGKNAKHDEEEKRSKATARE
jgi:hypothetical protein